MCRWCLKLVWVELVCSQLLTTTLGIRYTGRTLQMCITSRELLNWMLLSVHPHKCNELVLVWSRGWHVLPVAHNSLLKRMQIYRASSLAVSKPADVSMFGVSFEKDTRVIHSILGWPGSSQFFAAPPARECSRKCESTSAILILPLRGMCTN